jgi:hypothetical protein
MNYFDSDMSNSNLSILVTWRIVAFAVAGEARACQNFEIGGLPFHLALSRLRNFHVIHLGIIHTTIIDGKIRPQRGNCVNWIRQDEKADRRFQSFGKL